MSYLSASLFCNYLWFLLWVDVSNTYKVGQKRRVSLPLLTCSPSAWPSRLLYRRGRKSGRYMNYPVHCVTSQTTVLRAGVRLLQAGPPGLFLLWAQKFVTPALKIMFRITANFAYKHKPTCVITCAPCRCGNSPVLRVLFRHICTYFVGICWCTGSYIYLKLVCSEWRLPSVFVQTARALDASSDFEWLCAVCYISFLNYPKNTAARRDFRCSS